MASRTSWEGYLRLNLLSVPIKAYTVAVSGGGKIGFHLIHSKCQSRIHYKKVCPTHGEVPNNEIVSAYEFAKDQYVSLESEEREDLLPENDKAITIDTFIGPGDLDPIYYGDRSYYVVPDGRVAHKPYAVLQQVMTERNRFAVAKMILSAREHVVLIRPVGGLLVMTLLNYEEQVKKLSEFEDEIPEVTIAAKEHELAESLVEASTSESFDFAEYKDEYTGKLVELLETKSAGKKVSVSRHEDEPMVVNLMDALRQSLALTKRGGSSRKEVHPRKAKPKKAATVAPAKNRRVPLRRKTG
ncbi:MAG: Ku protein [Isosphaeraceae bacterium]